MYTRVKGNVYKNKRVLMENIHKVKAEKASERTLSVQLEAKRAITSKATPVCVLKQKDYTAITGSGSDRIHTFRECLSYGVEAP